MRLRFFSRSHGFCCSAFLISVIAVFASIGTPLLAQVHLVDVTRVLYSSYTREIDGLIADASGNLYLGGPDGIRELLASSGYTKLKTVATGMDQVRGMALDVNGNLFAADNGHGQVKEVVAVNGVIPFSPTIRTLASGVFPWGVAVDSSGNVFFSEDFSQGDLKEIVAVNGSIPDNPVVTKIGLFPFSYPRTIALESNGNLLVADDNAALLEILKDGGYSTVQTVVSGQFRAILLDADDNLYAAVGSNVEKFLASDHYATATTVAVGLDTFWLAMNARGNLVFNDSFDVGEILSKPEFSATAVGATSPPYTFGFSYDQATSPIATIAGVTEGAAGLDFTNSAYCDTRPSTCIVPVYFKPRASGARYGALEVLDKPGNVLAKAYLKGTGVAPQAIFAGSTATASSPEGKSTLEWGTGISTGVAVDASKNVYATHMSKDSVTKMLASDGYYSFKSLGSGLSSPQAVAVDGAGNLFVADTGNNAIKEIVTTGTQLTVNTLGSGFSAPQGVAVDWRGNVFVADTGNGMVKEIPVAGGYATVNAIGSGFSLPESVAVDADGNVFVADAGNGQVEEILADGGYVTVNVIGSGFGSPLQLAVDGNANLLVADGQSGALMEMVANGGYTQTITLDSAVGALSGMAVDANGNVFTANGVKHGVQKLDFVDPPAIKFAGTAQGTQSGDSPLPVMVFNLGNADLIFPAPANGKNPTLTGAPFAIDSSTTCPQIAAGGRAGKVAAGTSCVYALDFNPAVLGVFTGSLTFTDNYLNDQPPYYTTRSIPLSGMDVKAPVGHLDHVVDSVTYSSTVAQSDALRVIGWVADPQNGSPLANVTVYIDGSPLGTPDLDLPRPDIAAGQANLSYLYSGYEHLYPVAELSLGTHAVTVVATNSFGLSSTFGPVNITVATASVVGPPIGFFDRVGDSVTGSSTVSTGSLGLRGWVVDPVDGSPLSNVTVYIDGISKGKPTMGLLRPDIVAKFNNPAYAHAGFKHTYPVGSLASGMHTVTVVAIDSGGRSKTIGPRTFSVQ